MIAVSPVSLEGYSIRLEPLAPSHAEGLAAAAADGKLWELWFTAVPEPADIPTYIAARDRSARREERRRDPSQRRAS